MWKAIKRLLKLSKGEVSRAWVQLGSVGMDRERGTAVLSITNRSWQLTGC